MLLNHRETNNYPDLSPQEHSGLLARTMGDAHFWSKDHTQTIDFLLRKKIDFNKIDTSHRSSRNHDYLPFTALIAYKKLYNSDLMKIFLHKGADINSEDFHFMCVPKNYYYSAFYNCTMLQIAALNCHEEAFTDLLKLGADPLKNKAITDNIIEGTSKTTPTIIAMLRAAIDPKKLIKSLPR